MSDEAKKYEIAYIVSGEVAEDDVARVTGIITRHIEELRGMIRHIEEPKMVRLFYAIKKQRGAYFGHTTFSLDPAAIAELASKVKFEKEILRSLIVEEEEKPLKRHFGRAWDGAKHEGPKREPEEAPISEEEREAAIKQIDRQLDEILGTEKGL